MTIEEQLSQVMTNLAEIKQTLSLLAANGKSWYTTGELAQLVGKAEFTVREWCRLGRIKAEKRGSGRGKFPAWVVSHDEYLRFQREGLLPLAKH